MSLEPKGFTPEDFHATQIRCQCGGDSNGYDHRHSLSHLQWAWSERVRSGRIDKRLPPPIHVAMQQLP